ncbi:hypothetical protein LMH73_025525 [Vibrio splendidus]|nr:hypothetical protein [Vibrio splendidus]MCC4881876.1 hypothetical protein [Vibrio splendidus]
MSLLNEFKQRTFNISKQMNNIKVSTLRLAEAKANGFQTVKSYEAHLAQLDLDSHLITSNDAVIWMTNNCFESCFDRTGNDVTAIFRAMNLEYKTIDIGFDAEFYPLTDQEEELLDGDAVEFVNDWSFEFLSTAIVNNKKHLAVVYREYFETDIKEEEHSRDFLKAQVEKLKQPMLKVAQEFGGKLDWSNEPSWYDEHQGDFELVLFIPFDAVLNKVSNSKEYVELMSNAMKAKLMQAPN